MARRDGGGARITGPHIETAMDGIEPNSSHKISIALLNFYLLDGGER